MTDEVDLESFMRELKECKREVEIARQQFDAVIDPLLVDHLIFRLAAAERHLNYLFQLARRLNLVAEVDQWEWQTEMSV